VSSSQKIENRYNQQTMDQTNYSDSIIDIQLIEKELRAENKKRKKIAESAENCLRKLSIDKISGKMGDC